MERVNCFLIFVSLFSLLPTLTLTIHPLIVFFLRYQYQIWTIESMVLDRPHLELLHVDLVS